MGCESSFIYRGNGVTVLMKEFSNGENDGNYPFETFVMEYINDVRKLIYSYVKSHQTMEDLTQEVFISALQGYESFRGDSSIKTWLFKIAINKSKDYLKSWHYRRITLTNYFQDQLQEKTTENQFMTNQRNWELARVIMSLPLKYRETIILYYYHELTINEVSELLNINVNTAKTRLIRGRDLIKRRFDI
jgi:RNA polymerase sigma-70 factor, ECF subfamily